MLHEAWCQVVTDCPSPVKREGGRVQGCVRFRRRLENRGGGAASGSLESLFMDPHQEPLVLLIVTSAHTLVNRQPII